MSEAPGDRSGEVGGGGGVRGGPYLDLGSSPGGWTQVLRSSLHPSRTVLSADPAPLARRVSSLPGVVHLNANVRSEEAAAEMASLSLLSAVLCN